MIQYIGDPIRVLGVQSIGLVPHMHYRIPWGLEAPKGTTSNYMCYMC